MRLILSSQHIQELKKLAAQDPHLECCGYLLGSIQGQDNILHTIVPMQNIHPAPHTHFTFSPHDQIKVAQIIKKMPLQIIGIYHSHPSSPPLPSSQDLEFAFFAHHSFLIISLQNGITFASFRINAKKVQEERIEILHTS